MPPEDRTIIDQVPLDLRSEVRAGAGRTRTPTLTIAAGPEPGRYVSVDQATRAVFLGRDAACEFTLDDPSVSRRHARVYIDQAGAEGPTVILQDLGSTNGTRLNGSPVTRAVIEHGDRILVGDVLLRFEMLDPVDIAYREGVARRIKAAERCELTGLLRRKSMDDHLPSLVERCEQRAWPLSAVMLDIDHFKEINDTRGHAAGDVVLRRTGELLRDAIRKDDMAIRYGGEEFLLVLAGARRLHARLLAERLREAIASEEFPSLPGRRVTASLGVAERDPAEPIHAWLKRADQALYRAKQRGRNRSEAAPQPRAARG